MILDLMRHASTGRSGHLDGSTDSPLLAGAAQALAQRYRDRRWSGIASSPRRRAQETAQAISAGTAVRVLEDWAEFDFGQWEGCPSAAVPAAVLERFHADPERNPLPGAESWSSFALRIQRALEMQLQQPAQASGPVLVVTHAGAMRMALHCACAWTPAQSWALRLGYGTRLRLEIGRDPAAGLWGEVLELEQP